MDTPFSQTMDLCCKNLLPLKEYARRENNEINRFLNGCVKRAIFVKNWKFQVEEQLNLMNLDTEDKNSEILHYSRFVYCYVFALDKFCHSQRSN